MYVEVVQSINIWALIITWFCDLQDFVQPPCYLDECFSAQHKA